jgi:tetratricopeptide (TPR) repeat protein
MEPRLLMRAPASTISGALGALVSALLLAATPTADAAPPRRWEAARRGPAFSAEATALARAEDQLLAGKRLRRAAQQVDPLGAGGLMMHQQQARRILEAAGGARARDPLLRLQYGEVLSNLGAWAEAAAVLETVVDRVPGPLRVEALGELAVAYARLGRTREEIACYDRALALEPHALSQATMLANQAEAYMSTGDLARAIAGYRAALATLDPLSGAEVALFSPTIHWGLAVALDRSGELDAALDAVQRARSYDPADKGLSSSSWFYNPPHDEAWYAALGHLMVARRGPDLDVRQAAYQRAIERFREYVGRAPPDDRWLPLARSHVTMLLTEQARFEKRLRTPLPGRRGASLSD